MADLNLPILDLSQLDAGPAGAERFGDELRAATHDVGFFYLTGTGVSGMLRALEQAWGRDPATMMPDLRYTPNPHDAPGGPLVERGE